MIVLISGFLIRNVTKAKLSWQQIINSEKTDIMAKLPKNRDSRNYSIIKSETIGLEYI